MRRWIVSIILVVSLIPLVALGQGASLSALFEEGNNAFWNGDYEQAAAKYGELIELGVDDAVVYYNLGTASARLGQLGSAVRFYEKTLRVDPGHPDATDNLTVIREHIAKRASRAGRDADLAPAVDPWRAVLDRFTLSGATALFLVVYLAFFAALIARRFLRASEMRRLTASVVAGIFLIVSAATGAIVVGKWRLHEGAGEAVIVGGEVTPVMEGPASEVQRFVLDEGTRVIVIGEQDQWAKVRDDQGRDGWLPQDSLGTL